MDLGCRRKPVSRLFSGMGLQSAGPLPSARGGGGSRAGRRVDPRAQHVVHRGPGALAEALSKRSFGGQCFFCNSGAEANEAAIKLARAYGSASGRFQIITMEGGFHGRTLAALSATAQPKYHAGFEPLVPGFVYVPYDNVLAVAKAICDQTAAILVEPIQGEGGINVPRPGYLEGLRRLCDDRGVLLMLDEVQTGMGRTGAWFAYQHDEGIEPDVLTCAKALAGGFAAGVMIARPEVASVLKPGMHASTFGGNPIACRASLATIETIEAEGLLEREGDRVSVSKTL